MGKNKQRCMSSLAPSSNYGGFGIARLSVSPVLLGLSECQNGILAGMLTECCLFLFCWLAGLVGKFWYRIYLESPL
ncbi:hypothetical protein MRB53_023105 [Persea americana]|uniref:Uncharacterized protein n=1 Tax=Persea americana TaxID=3435 RepID=A0ACC2L8V3_PERAE|nr:hypothetical protein MRB53_023105 [Persea americana]